MKKILWCDLETRSRVSLFACGSFRYAESAEVLLFLYAIDDGKPRHWAPALGEPMPDDLRAALDEVMRGERLTVWHNGVLFDSIVLKKALGIDIPPRQIVDTMVIAYEHGLPGALGDLTHVIFRMADKDAKDARGKMLIRKFCQPNKDGEYLSPSDAPEDWKAFIAYGLQDVAAMRNLFKKLPKWNITAWERRVQMLDLAINRRGIQIDMDLVRASLRLAEENKTLLADKVRDATNGEVLSATQRDALKSYIEDTYGVKLKDMSKSNLENVLNDDATPAPVRELLQLRLSSSKTSVSKNVTTSNWVNSDGRLRGTLQFRGAFRTGRFSGRGPQFQNLARPSIKSAEEIEAAIESVKNGTAPWFYDDLGKLLANCLRGEIISAPGKKLVVADFSNIEGRVLAFLAVELWKIEAFRAYDAGTGHDLYKVTYGKAFNVDPASVTKDQRQMGKVLELALGYGGGAGAFATFAKGFNIDLNDMADKVKVAVDPSIWAEAEKSYFDFFLPKRMTRGMTQKVFVACDAMKRAWRKANPAIVELWRAADAAITKVIRGEAPSAKIGRYVTADMKGSYLRLRLPSGRYLTYAQPIVDDDGISYMGMDREARMARKWARQRSYGAKFVENITQAVACDVLCESMLCLDEAGYKAVLTIHDEIITEVPDTNEYSYEEMARIMAVAPSWAQGLPLSVDGFEGHRYRKK